MQITIETGTRKRLADVTPTVIKSVTLSAEEVKQAVAEYVYRQLYPRAEQGKQILYQNLDVLPANVDVLTQDWEDNCGGATVRLA